MGQTARYLIRTALFGIGSANAALLTALYADQAINGRFIALLVSLGVGSALAYAGIGAAVPQVEGGIGNKLPPAQAVEEAVTSIKDATDQTEAATKAVEGIAPA